MQRKYQLAKQQQGMTFLGLVIVIAAIVAIAFVAMKVVPAYTEFFSVKNVIKRIASESNFNEMSKKEIIESFDKGASVSYITAIKGSELIIEKGDSGNVVTAEYQMTIPLVANASLLLDFRASSEK